MNLVSLLIATSVVKYDHNVGLRTAAALVAVAIVIAAVVVSKRRAHSLGDEAAEADSATAATAATAPAAVPGPTAAPDATVGAVPPAREPDETSPNGHVAATEQSKPAE
jgi:K(+)-stimulated pyrophosphate-energized sodium pump